MKQPEMRFNPATKRFEPIVDKPKGIEQVETRWQQQITCTMCHKDPGPVFDVIGKDVYCLVCRDKVLKRKGVIK